MPLDFLFICFVVFVLSAFVLTLATRTTQPDSLGESSPAESEKVPEDRAKHPPFDDLDEFVEAISRDKDFLAASPPIQIPAVDLPGAKLGGGASGEAYSKTTGELILTLNVSTDERRRYSRRMNDRRVSEASHKDERRMVQRRVWLRRDEDRRGKRMLNVSDAADTLGVPVERIYKWLDDTDIPFYQVTEGRKKAIRFEIDELLQWYSAFSANARAPRREL